MNYSQIYKNLITSRQNLNRARTETLKYENHHIIPKSLGGTNDKTNLVLLTFKEHFIAHLLLTKMYEGDSKRKMYFAFRRMSYNRISKQKQTSSQYSASRKISVEHTFETKQKISQSLKGRIITETHRNNLSNSLKNKTRTKEQKQKMSISQMGHFVSEKTKKQMSERMKKFNPFKGKTHSLETKNKLRELAKNQIRKPHSAETKQKMSETKQKNKLLRINQDVQ